MARQGVLYNPAKRVEVLIADRLVAVENISAEITITGPDEVGVYSTLMR